MFATHTYTSSSVSPLLSRSLFTHPADTTGITTNNPYLQPVLPNCFTANRRDARNRTFRLRQRGSAAAFSALAPGADVDADIATDSASFDGDESMCSHASLPATAIAAAAPSPPPPFAATSTSSPSSGKTYINVILVDIDTFSFYSPLGNRFIFLR